MKKMIFFFIFLISCSLNSSNEVESIPIVELPYKNLDGQFVSENLTNKNTIIVFWADY
jgi:hypothetical protein